MKTFLAVVGAIALIGICLLGWAGAAVFGAKVHQGVELPFLSRAKPAQTLDSTLYVWGYGTADKVVKEAREKCPDCRLVILTSLDDPSLPKGRLSWSNIATKTAKLTDRCTTAQELLRAEVKFAIAKSSPCK